MATTTTKLCKPCNTVKPIDEFHRRNGSPCGRVSKCKECASNYSANRYARNAEKFREQTRKKRLDNREDFLRQRREWASKNTESISKSSERYRKTPKGKATKASAMAAYRARKRSAFVERIDAGSLFDGACCVYCGGADNLSIDHVVPLSRGGTHEPQNVVVACCSCNSSKNNRLLSELPIEWFEARNRNQTI